VRVYAHTYKYVFGYYLLHCDERHLTPVGGADLLKTGLETRVSFVVKIHCKHQPGFAAFPLPEAMIDVAAALSAPSP
jgi:hypothetical protein